MIAEADAVDAITASDLIVLLVLDYGTAREVLDRVTGEDLAGRTIVGAMTGSSHDAIALAEYVHGRGGRYLDAALEMYPVNIGTREGLINFGGDLDAWDEWRALLDPLAGTSVFLGTDPALPAYADAALAGGFFNVAMGGFLEAASFATRVGLSLEDLRPFVRVALALLEDHLLNHAIPAIDSGDFSTDQATVAVYLRAVRIWREEMIAAGQRAGLMTANLHNLEIAESAGYGASAIYAEYLTSRA
ncbi:hypothetical protein A6035_00665 [Dietzia lutea]|uniref:NADPH-dependent reductive aminase-like C-terminal domain-containing protein n=1 Tax=Dietzia lutea TaxID=546160 RepID=A0A2S1R3Q9_9ACTN|nr:hypothetical protein A6035_00665 [Dietzia lutea]